MADARFKFACTCGQRLMARESMVGRTVFCPACRREITIPERGEQVDESRYQRVERYALVCSCGCRILVKAGAAGKTIHCPECTAAVRVPPLNRLSGGKTPAMVDTKAPPARREYIDTQDLILLVDDEEGPGTDIG
jgi:hypothetical protein